MKRIIIDYKKLDRETAALLIDSYPDGYGDDDIIVLKKSNGEIVETVEIRTDDTIYLVKISNSLSHFISNFEETISKELETQTPEALIEKEMKKHFETEMDSEEDSEEENQND